TGQKQHPSLPHLYSPLPESIFCRSQFERPDTPTVGRPLPKSIGSGTIPHSGELTYRRPGPPAPHNSSHHLLYGRKEKPCAGAKAGAKGAYLAVGTYPFAGAFAATVRAGEQKGFARVKVGAGVAAVYARRRPTNVYLAFRGADYQIELFDPKPGEARRIVAE